jgi:toxin CcdB
MAKFDVYRLQSGNGFLLDCQADLLSDLNTRFVVPLLPVEEAPKPAARLNPVFDIQGESYVMVTQFAAAVPASELKIRIMSLGEQSFMIGNALDMLISGY